MIIWGSVGREIEQDSGRFYCPSCDSDQRYIEYRVASYFTLYFIPLFETQHHGNYVLCRSCKGQFKPRVLEIEPPTQASRVLASVRADLESGMPISMARTKLRNAGIDPEPAEQILELAIEGSKATCGACNLAYLGTVYRCNSCGAPLHSATLPVVKPTSASQLDEGR